MKAERGTLWMRLNFGVKTIIGLTESILNSLPGTVAKTGVDALLLDTAHFYAELGAIELESLKGKRCCRQVKFYSGVSPLTSRWCCLSRILRAGPRPWSDQILKRILFTGTPQ
jgi:hypothetical protein